jgi:hypothetical protein
MRVRIMIMVTLVAVAALLFPLNSGAGEKPATLKVSCAPGVTVMLDGQSAGQCMEDGSGLLIGGVPAGNHVLRLSAEGFMDKVIRIQVAQGQSMAVAVDQLDPAPTPTVAPEKAPEKAGIRAAPSRRRPARVQSFSASRGRSGTTVADSADERAESEAEAGEAPAAGAEGADQTPTEAAGGETKAQAETTAEPGREPGSKAKAQRRAAKRRLNTRGDPDVKDRVVIDFQARGASRKEGRTISFFYLPEGGGKPELILNCQIGPFFQLPISDSVVPGTYRYLIRFVHETGSGEATKVVFEHEEEIAVEAVAGSAFTVDAYFGGDEPDLCRTRLLGIVPS